MLNRSGARTGSKSARQARRSIVFRFLAGCKQEELLFYLKMAFRVFTPRVQGKQIFNCKPDIFLICLCSIINFILLNK